MSYGHPALLRETPFKGERNIVSTLYFSDSGGGDHDTKRDICYFYIESEDNKVDVQFNDLAELRDSFNAFLEEYPCGAPEDLEEQVQDCILEDIKLVLGSRWSVRNFNYEAFKPL